MNNSYQSSTYSHIGQHASIGPSNLKILHGEDLTYGDRKRLQQLQQQDWLDQQVMEKNEIAQANKTVKDYFDLNTKTITDMRAELENQKAARLRDMQIACKITNKQQLDEKLNLQRLRRTEDTIDKLNHVDFITGNDFYTENTATCQSMLGRNRVLPYHWKGMNEEQKQTILLEQERQRKQKQLQKELEKEQERLFAEQQKAQRKMLIKLDRSKKSGASNVRKGVDEFNLLKAEEMKRKVYHAYDEIHTFKNE